MKKCRCCNNEIEIAPKLSYNNMPGVAQNFPDSDSLEDDKGICFEIYQCPYCGLIQILEDPVWYYKDVIRAVAVSEDMKDFRQEYFKEFIRQCNLEGKKIIEIGAGCGEYMQMAGQNNIQIYGLEHSEVSVSKARECGLHVFRGYIDSASYRIPEAPYDAFYILNFLEHIPDPRTFLQGISANLKEDAFGLIEVPNADFILKNKMFSEFMIDHLSYFTEKSLRVMLEINGFELKSCEVIWKDYILSAIVKKRGTFDKNLFEKRESDLVFWINDFLKEMQKAGRKVAVWGAGHQALAIMSLAKLKNRIECVIDSADFKQNKFTPASHIPIYAPDKIRELGIGAILVIAGSYSNEVCGYVKENYKDILVKELIFPEK